MLRTRYKAVEARLAQLDWNKLWPRFAAYPFALYNEHEACTAQGLTERPDDFRGNTAIAWNGETTAIWRIGDDSVQDDDVLTANIVHEMFHAHQQRMGEQRYPDDLRLLRCPPCAKALALRIREHKLLATGECERLKDVFALRRLRQQVSPEDARQGFLAETVEGLAEWIGYGALAQLNRNKAEEMLQGHVRCLSMQGITQMDTRRMAYSSGVVMLTSAARIGLQIIHDQRGAVQSISELLAAQLPECVCSGITPEEEQAAALLVEQHHAENQRRIMEFRSRAHQRHTGDWRICGYDPMNMIRLQDEILCTHFVMLQDRQGRTHTLMGETLLLMCPGSDRHAAAYVRA